MTNKKVKQCASKWDEAIADARRNIERLRTVIVVCEEKKAAGESWPGDEQIKRQLREQQRGA